MRNFIVWTLSFLLVFEPSVWAANRPTINEMKEVIELSELTKRSMTLKELYRRSSSFLPKNIRDQLEPVVDEYADYQIPKFSVTKLKNSKGEEYYQLSAVKDGRSVTLSLGENTKTLLKINGQVIEAADMNSIVAIMTKANVSKNELKTMPVAKRVPAQVYILNTKQIEKLSLEQKRTYYKQLRGLLESMEAVGNASIPKEKKSSQRKPASINTFAALLVGDQAMAGGSVGGACVAAGYVAEVNYNKQRGGLSCGVDTQGNVAQQYRGSCSPRQFFCNPDVYGPNGGCVEAGRETTAVCNRVIGSEKDIPDLNQDNRQRFEVLRTKAMDYSGEVLGVCGESTRGPLAEDQSETCSNFNNRSNEIASWDCNIPAFKSKYPKLCSGVDQPGPGSGGAGQNPPPGVGNGTDGSQTPPGPQNPPPANGGNSPGAPSVPGVGGLVDDRDYKCESLPVGYVKSASRINCGAGGDGNAHCTDKDGASHLVSFCHCDTGAKLVDGPKCVMEKSGGDGYDSWKRDRERRREKSGPNWLLIFGAGAVGLLAYHFLAKKAVKQSYQNIDPLPAATPVPVDVTAPGAR